jgi:hypothetical protein
MLELIKPALCIYAVTFLLTDGHVFGWWRRLLVATIGRFARGYPVETCRMCQGVWVTVALAAATGMTPLDALAAYGLSYFLATQERL